jgi:hypothetical protein
VYDAVLAGMLIERRWNVLQANESRKQLEAAGERARHENEKRDEVIRQIRALDVSNESFAPCWRPTNVMLAPFQHQAGTNGTVPAPLAPC